MCGIAFVINSAPHAGEGKKAVSSGSLKLNALFKDLMLVSAVRGVDGTGVYQVDGGYEVWTGKHALPSAYGLDMTGIREMVSDVSNCPITVGHVRAATQGSVNDDNSHPFQGWRDDGSYIIGVHNGTLYGWDTPKNDFDVDSAWAIDTIASYGAKAFDEFYGAWAFVWYDTNHPGKVFFVRNDDRPLHIARTKDKRTIIGASEPWMIEGLCAKHGIEIEEVLSVDEDYLMSVDTKQPELTIEEVCKVEGGWSYSPSYSSHYVTPPPALPAPEEPATSWSPAKQAVIREVKECLRQARWLNRIDDSNDMDSPPFEMGPVEEPFIRAKSGWFDDSVASKDEIKRAMYEGMYGAVVQYEAVEFDKYNDSIVGEIVAPAVLNHPLAYVTNTNEQEAKMFENSVHHMVVVGARTFGKETEYIVTDLTKEGLEALAV